MKLFFFNNLQLTQNLNQISLFLHFFVATLLVDELLKPIQFKYKMLDSENYEHETNPK